MALRAIGVVVIMLAMAGGWDGWNRSFRTGPARAVAHVTRIPSQTPSAPTVAALQDDRSAHDDHTAPDEHAPRDGRAAADSQTVAPPADFYRDVLADLDEGRLKQAES